MGGASRKERKQKGGEDRRLLISNSERLFAGACGCCLGLLRPAEFLEQLFHATSTVSVDIYVMMTGTVGVHHCDLCGRASLLDHERQVMTVITVERGAKNHEVKGALVQGILNALPPDRRLHAVASGVQHRRA